MKYESAKMRRYIRVFEKGFQDCEENMPKFDILRGGSQLTEVNFLTGPLR